MKNSNCLNVEIFRGLLKKYQFNKGSKAKVEPGSRKGRDQGDCEEKETFSVRMSRENSVQIRGFYVKYMKLGFSSRTGLVLK